VTAHPLLAAGRRLVVLVGAAILVTAGLSAAIGAAVGSDATRAAATGLYLVGSFLILLGVFAGLRGPVRPRGKDEEQQPLAGLFGLGIFSAGVRTASADERADARSTTWLFLALGVAMVVAGVLLDPRTDLF
jgi:uncharacterized membrane protein HdeD (DUF308 family)